MKNDITTENLINACTKGYAAINYSHLFTTTTKNPMQFLNYLLNTLYGKKNTMMINNEM